MRTVLTGRPMRADGRSARRSTAGKVLATAAAASVIFTCGNVGAAFAAQGVSTTNDWAFSNPAIAITDMSQPLILMEPAVWTTWSQGASFDNGSGEVVATSTLTIYGEEVNTKGATRALLVWQVNAAETASDALVNDACRTRTESSECVVGVTIPRGKEEVLRLVRTLHDASNGDYWWDASITPASGSQQNVGLIEIPGGTTTIDATAGVANHTEYVGVAKACDETPRSTIDWFNPRGGPPGEESWSQPIGTFSIAPGTCEAESRQLSFGGSPLAGVQVTAPKQPGGRPPVF